ncbi:MAG: AMP-binding protein [Pseudomonadota bacterium]
MTSLFSNLEAQFPPSNTLFARLDGRDDCTYGDVLAGSAQVANHLISLGLEPGDRVAAQVPKSIDALMLYLGAVRAGGVFLPLNTAYTAAELDYFLTDASPRVFVSDPAKAHDLAPVADKAGAYMRTIAEFAEAAGKELTQFETVARDDDDLAAILYTSGTTGRSKGAMLTHANLWSNAKALVETWRFTKDDFLIHALPIFHTHGLFVATHCVLASGSALHLLERFDADRVLDLMAQEAPNPATVLMGVPTFYTRLLKNDRLPAAAQNMRLFTSGSAPLLAETHRAFERATGQRIVERYGMTETNMNTSNPYDGERRAGTVGAPLPGVELRIMSDSTKVEAGDVGSIQVRGTNVFKGYWQMLEKTAEEFTQDGWFITGDLGQMSPDGYLTIVGRDKDMVITGGFNVYPVEVEDLIDRLDGVVESAVVGLPHDDFGEAVTAFVVADTPLEEAAILDSISSSLARYKQPKRVLFLDELPRNTMGKVQKAALRKENAKLYSS